MRASRLLVYGLVAVCLAAPVGCSRPELSLYCAQDKEFAEGILDTFHKDTGLAVTTTYDTEADKSVSLYEKIKGEKDRPRCDVFWNNEILSTIRLQQLGLLLPYESPSAKPYPAWTKANDHTWQAFAARPRILIVNTELLAEDKERPHSLLELTDKKWAGQVVMSRPQFGTSATQAACLFEVLGSDKARDYYKGLKRNDVRLAPGNKQVAEWVAAGKTPAGDRVVVGITDPDDALEEIHHGKKVAIIFPDGDAPKDGKFGTLFIPNSVAIIKGSANPDAAKKLVDYLLSASVETKLAESDSHQVPLNPEVKAKLPPEFEGLSTVKRMDVDFVKAAAQWDEVQTFLREVFAR